MSNESSEGCGKHKLCRVEFKWQWEWKEIKYKKITKIKSFKKNDPIIHNGSETDSLLKFVLTRPINNEIEENFEKLTTKCLKVK